MIDSPQSLTAVHGCVFRQNESSVVNFVGARLGSGVRVGFQSLLLGKAWRVFQD